MYRWDKYLSWSGDCVGRYMVCPFPLVVLGVRGIGTGVTHPWIFMLSRLCVIVKRWCYHILQINCFMRIFRVKFLDISQCVES